MTSYLSKSVNCIIRRRDELDFHCCCETVSFSITRGTGQGRKCDFAHISLVDRIGHEESHWIEFWQNILLF